MIRTETICMSHIFITGASSGIGAALASQWLADGHKVTAVARRRERLDEIGQHHTSFFAGEGDVTDAGRMAELVDEATTRLGPIDVAIMNAGIYVPQDSRQIDPAVYAQHMDVNYMGVINSLAPIVPIMAERKSGQIAIVSSVAGWRGLPKAAAYGPTKAALISLAESLVFDLAPQGIDVRVICPGFVDTESTAVNDYEMPGLMTADAAATEITRGLRGDKFVIQFPKSFTRQMGLLRWLPDRKFFQLVAKRTGISLK